MTVHEDDDMAHNVLKAQQADAMPTEAERKRAVTCDGCGVTKEDARMRGTLSYVPSCPAIQSAPPKVYCDECWSQKQTKEDAVRDYIEHGDADCVVEYECGVLKAINIAEEKEKAGFAGENLHRGWSPEVRLQHDRCGSVIETVWTPSDLEDEGDES